MSDATKYNLKLICYIVVPMFVLFGCGVTSQQLKNQYKMKPLNKALASGKDLYGNEILGASWGFSTYNQAKKRALVECQKRGIDCKIINVNGSPYSTSISTTHNNNSGVASKEYNSQSQHSSHRIEYTCSEISESQAYSLLRQGHTYLDKDGDGQPCEWGQQKTYNPSRSYNTGNCHWVNGYHRRNGTYVKGYMRCR